MPVVAAAVVEVVAAVVVKVVAVVVVEVVEEEVEVTVMGTMMMMTTM